MTYELAKELKDAGFTQELKENVSDCVYYDPLGQILVASGAEATLGDGFVKKPNLSELIEACGRGFFSLEFNPYDDKWKWRANMRNEGDGTIDPYGKTPVEAVAKLYLALNK